MNINWWAVFGKFGLYFVMPLVASTIGSLAVLLGPAFGYLNKDRELDIEMVRISLSILASEKQAESEWGRRFALRALEKYAAVEIPEVEFFEWAKNGTLPNVVPKNSTSAFEASKDGKRQTCIERPVRRPEFIPDYFCFDDPQNESKKSSQELR